MHRTRLHELPPFPRIPSRENLQGSITTRILAERLNKRRESQSMSEKETSKSQSSKSQSLRSDDRSRSLIRTPVKFLRGAALPNSVARSTSQATDSATNDDDRRTHKAKRDAYVEEVIRRLHLKLYPSVETAVVRSSKDATTSTNEEKISELSLSTRKASTASNDQASVSIKEAAEEDSEKERVRIARRTSVLSPLLASYKKPPTRESIKNAISNSKTVPKVIDVNSMERKKWPPSNQDASGVFSVVGPSWATLRIRASKASRASKRMAGRYLRQKSILKPARTVSTSENKKEDSQTQTVLRMEDLRVIGQFVVGD